MEMKCPYTIAISLPSDLEVIPAVRKFISEVLVVSGFSQKFAFRTEIIVDAVCNNAINYGCENETNGGNEDDVNVKCVVHDDRVEIVVKDKGGNEANIEKLREAINRSGAESAENAAAGHIGMGLEIVKLLAETVEMRMCDNNLTSIHVISRRGDF